MPYVDDDGRREQIMFKVEQLSATLRTEGDLNFAITKLLLCTLPHSSYSQLGDSIKALECAKLEFYRRMLVPYEDEKCEQNGDVYPDRDC